MCLCFSNKAGPGLLLLLLLLLCRSPATNGRCAPGLPHVQLRTCAVRQTPCTASSCPIKTPGTPACCLCGNTIACCRHWDTPSIAPLCHGNTPHSCITLVMFMFMVTLPLTSYMVLRNSQVPSGPNTCTGMSAFSCPFSREAPITHSTPGRPSSASGDCRLMTMRCSCGGWVGGGGGHTDTYTDTDRRSKQAYSDTDTGRKSRQADTDGQSTQIHTGRAQQSRADSRQSVGSRHIKTVHCTVFGCGGEDEEQEQLQGQCTTDKWVCNPRWLCT